MSDKNKGLAEVVNPADAPAGAVQHGHQHGPHGPRTYTVRLARQELERTEAAVLWVHTLTQSETLGFDAYNRFIERVLFEPSDVIQGHTEIKVRGGLDPYELLKTATEVFLLTNVGVMNQDALKQEGLAEMLRRNESLSALPRGDANGNGDITKHARRDAEERASSAVNVGNDLNFASLRQFLGGSNASYVDSILPHVVPGGLGSDATDSPFTVSGGDPSLPCLLELIWSYWHEEGMLSQTLNAVARRFQNVRRPGGSPDPLAELELAPLRPLSALLWGYVNDEQHRLSVVRRAYEYQHHYGVSLYGKATQGLTPADSRSHFIEAFHELLRRCAQFFLQDDDATVTADAFPILQALKEVHLVLAEGAHNQFRDLPWTARKEMLMEQWMLARPEMRDFLRGRWMMPYPEPWMGGVDAMKRLQGWSDTSVMHFRDLGTYGERLLLSIRYYAWMNTNDQEVARTWARFWRPEVQSYLHAYRVVTGVDLASLDYVDATVPSEHLKRRLAEQRQSSGALTNGNGALLAPSIGSPLANRARTRQGRT